MHRNDRDERGISRRTFHRLSAATLVAAASPLLARRALAEDPLVTEIEANQPLLTSLQYVNESQKEGQNCAGCLLFAPGEGGRGKCQLFLQGVVSEKGWCLSWAKKP